MQIQFLPNLRSVSFAKQSAALLIVLFVVFASNSAVLAKAKDVPRSEDGYANSQISDGKQNYPLEL